MKYKSMEGSKSTRGLIVFLREKKYVFDVYSWNIEGKKK